MLEATLAGIHPIQMPVDSSRLEGFYKLSVSARREKLAEIAGLTPEQVEAWSSSGELSEDAADRMIENVVGTYSLPIGIATNFVIDGEHYLIPFVLEEPSVVAAASNGKALPCQRRIHFKQRRASDDWADPDRRMRGSRGCERLNYGR
jgi:degradative hydroxymethylglutaryl-CoA reductase